MIPNKLPRIPSKLFNTPCYISINETIGEDGEPLYEHLYKGKCIVVNKTKNVMDAEKHIIRLEGTIILDGDILPGVTISSGVAHLNGWEWKIYRCYKPQNPDGTVHHTELELM